MTFSGALVSRLVNLCPPGSPLISPLQTLTDLNDYITPSQACIKPLEQSNAPKARTPGDAAVRADPSDLWGVNYHGCADGDSDRRKWCLLRGRSG